MPEWCEAAPSVSEGLLAELGEEAAVMAAEAAAKAAKAALCSLDTPQITDGDESKPKKVRRPSLKKLMDTMDLHSWLQVAVNRALRSKEFLDKALRAQGYWVPDWMPDLVPIGP
jgi:hypothetical protein